jgi:hypothetical protein
MRPNERMTVLLFFVLPISILPKFLAIILAGLELFGLLFAELPRGGLKTSIAHSAHLGGMLAALIFFRVWSGASQFVSSSPSIELPKWMKSKRTGPDVAGKFRVNVSRDKDIKQEVDRILDKINHSGFGSLTPEEKRTLDDARDTLGRRLGLLRAAEEPRPARRCEPALRTTPPAIPQLGGMTVRMQAQRRQTNSSLAPGKIRLSFSRAV